MQAAGRGRKKSKNKFGKKSKKVRTKAKGARKQERKAQGAFSGWIEFSTITRHRGSHPFLELFCSFLENLGQHFRALGGRGEGCVGLRHGRKMATSSWVQFDAALMIRSSLYLPRINLASMPPNWPAAFLGRGAGPIWKEEFSGRAISRFCWRAFGLGDRVEATAHGARNEMLGSPGWAFGASVEVEVGPAWLSRPRPPAH